jgi:hypothetical protein
MQASEKLFLQTVGRFISERFKVWIAPISERIEAIERALAQPKDGNHGADGADGKNLTATDINDIVDAKIAGAFANLLDKPHVVGFYIDRAGDLHSTHSDGGVFKIGHVVGADADEAKIIEALKAHVDRTVATWPKPKDGKDGFSLDNFDVQFDGKRTITLCFVDKENIPLERKIVLPVPLYCGVWREGTFNRGDCVTHEGSLWIALGETLLRPGTPDSDWQLAVKRGRDGREGKQGPPGSPGKDGRDGRDLTQLGPDGKKW